MRITAESSLSFSPDSSIYLGRIGKPFRLEGFVRLLSTLRDDSDNDYIDLFAELPTPIQCLSSSGQHAELILEQARLTNKGWLLKFDAIDTPESATQLTGHRIYISQDDIQKRLPLSDDNEFYSHDMPGMHLRSQKDNTPYGIIRSIYDIGPQTIIMIERNDHQEIAIPFLEIFFTQYNSDERCFLIEPTIFDDFLTGSHYHAATACQSNIHT